MKNNKTIQRIMSFVMILGIISSCGRYNYLSSKVSNATVNYQKNDVKELTNYVVVHHGSDVFRLMDAKIENGQLVGTRGVVDDFQENVYASALNGSSADLLIDDAKSFLDKIQEQTHVYLDESYEIDSENIAIGLNDIDESKSLFKTKEGVQVFLTVLLIIGVVVLACAAGAVIMILVTCNCPHVYTFDGERYRYANTLFTGSTGKNLERNDYKVLYDFSSNSQEYNMYIKNEDNESQYTNVLELIEVVHSDNTEIIPSPNGSIHSISNVIKPVAITNEGGEDLSSLSSYHDEMGYVFDSESSENMINTYVKFEKPSDVSNTKLVLNLKNTKWGALVAKSFGNMMGDKYEGWVKKNHKRSSEKAFSKMKEAGIPLVVSIKKDDDWVDIETIYPLGDVSYTSLAFSVDEELISGKDIEIRLQAGFKFWDLDYVGVDFSKDKGFDVRVHKPIVTNREGQNDLLSIYGDDELYMSHTNSGDSTFVKFEGLTTSADKRTLILHSKGYYLSKDEFSGRPYLKELLKLNVPGGFSKLSRELYSEYIKNYALQGPK